MARKLNPKPETRNPKFTLPNFQRKLGRARILNSKFQPVINKTRKNWKRALEEFKFNEALIAIWRLIGFCDKYIEKERPWEKSEKQLSIINDLLITLKNIAQLLQPFLPETSEKILKQLKTKKGEILFPLIK